MAGIAPDRKQAIAERWLAVTVETYPSQARQFLLGEKDPFRNPAGHILREQTSLVVEELLGGMDERKVAEALSELVRLRAVQNFTARQAVGFVFLLKNVVRDELSAESAARFELNSRIDEMALTAFDLFVRCREEINEARLKEAKRRVGLLEKMYSGSGAG